MPYEIIANDLKSQKASAEMMSKNMIIGGVQAAMDPMVKKNNGVLQLRPMANSIPSMRMTITELLPL